MESSHSARLPGSQSSNCHQPVTTRTTSQPFDRRLWCRFEAQTTRVLQVAVIQRDKCKYKTHCVSLIHFGAQRSNKCIATPPSGAYSPTVILPPIKPVLELLVSRRFCGRAVENNFCLCKNGLWERKANSGVRWAARTFERLERS